MPSNRRLPAIKWSPSLIFGHVSGDEIAPATIEHAHMRDDYIENTFAAGAGGVLRQIVRLFIQDGRLVSEETDEF